MANEEHLAILRQGVEGWNRWRQENPEVRPDLSEAGLREANLPRVNLRGGNLCEVDLSYANLEGADFKEANLSRANLREANLPRVNLCGADLCGSDFSRTNLIEAYLVGAKSQAANMEEANLYKADLYRANLSRANLRRAKLEEAILTGANLAGTILTGTNLTGADLTYANLTYADLTYADLEGSRLRRANLSEANLRGANLQQINLIEVTLDQAILTECSVYGLSVWDATGIPKDQSSLIITPANAPMVTVDDLEVAQFIYLLLNREKLRNIITTITSKAVLILGRFTPERKAVLDAMADELRRHNLLPIIFDFERATTRDFTETIKTLAGLSLFVIADITNPKSAPLELQATVPNYQIPFVAIIQEGEQPFAMFRDLPKYPWVYDKVITYPSVEKLLQGFKQGIIDRAWAMSQELIKEKARKLETESIEDFVKDDTGQIGG